jgi:beta-ribofuranosylaminobenzene 5'-phosphate synthase
MRVVVEAAARLHLGFLDLNGDCGRLFGSLGVAIDHPRCVVEARPAGRAEATGDSAGDVREVLDALGRARGAAPAVAVRTRESIPRHAGLGSGTQLRLAAARAAARVLDWRLPVRELARLAGRGRRSGIGVAVFERGGFVVDAGHRYQGREVGRDEELPPVIVRHAVPRDWCFVIVTPPDAPGLSGSPEERVFQSLPPMSGDTVGRICRLLLMKAAPAVATDDIRAFGEAITEIQLLVGEHFAPFQGGGVYASPAGKRAVELALKAGAAGVGQSSWGPTVFALVRGRDGAAGLAEELRGALGAETRVWSTRVRNRGARCRMEP